MTGWKLTTILLAILLGISLMWNVQQKANFEKQQLKEYSIEHSQLTYSLKTIIDDYESTEDQQELSLRLAQSIGFVSNTSPSGDTLANLTADFDYAIISVFNEVNNKAIVGKTDNSDIEKLKLIHELLIMFEKMTLHKVDSKSLETFEFDFKRFMNYYNGKKGSLFK